MRLLASPTPPPAPIGPAPRTSLRPAAVALFAGAALAAAALLRAPAARAQSVPAADRFARDVAVARAELDRAIAAAGLHAVDVGLHVRELDGGATFHDELRIVTPENKTDQLLRTASTMKLFTTAAVLETFGADHEIRGPRFVRARLGKQVRTTNLTSNNQLAQMLFLYLGYKQGGKYSGTAAVKALREYLDGVGLAGEYKISDGSGQSSGDKFLPSQLTCLLHHMAGTTEAANFRDSLPLAGDAAGTLAGRFLGFTATERAAIRAKTGHTSGANALAGYVGNRFAFAILVNRYGIDEKKSAQSAIHRVMDQVVRALLRAGRPTVDPTTGRATDVDGDGGGTLVGEGNGEGGGPGAVRNLDGVDR
ncbi:MAG: D-alanyl-D-alanine carboxypeptidase [Planctomycetes bacterium]|nr:D-alanyl-D-alanine carboxypeptidase [Planctomycetota bacterium]